MSKVLLLDNYGNRTVFRFEFSGDFEVLTAATVRDALELCERHDVAVVLAEVDLLDGRTLLAALRERHPRVVRIAVTASEPPLMDDQDLIACYLQKPWRAPELRRLLTSATAWHKLAV